MHFNVLSVTSSPSDSILITASLDWFCFFISKIPKVDEMAFNLFANAISMIFAKKT